MGHPPCFVSLPALLLATTLATACGTTDETPPMAEATLAFTQDTSIYTISTEEGSTPSLLLSGYVRPSWSPDGRTFAMVRTGPPPQPFFPSNQALYLADADGGNARALAGFSYPIIETPVWSPDGASLLYLREKSGFGPPTVYTIRLAAAGGPETTLDGVLFAPLPSWSRDGSVIAVDHAGLTVLLNATSYDTVLTLPGGWPRLSPVNDDLAFREPTTGHIHLMRSDNTGDRDLGVDGYPDAWSPDGKRLSFVGSDGYGTFYTIKPDGSGLSQVGPTGDVRDVVWSADSRRIAYFTNPSSGPQTIYIARPDGSDARPIYSAAGICCLSWRP